MPATFGDIYGRLCERWTDPRERGRQFEPLVERVLSTDRIFRERYASVWRWGEWPGRRSVDIGVDIVAQRSDGGLTAIQCKCYDPDSTLYEQNLATFLAYTNADFDERLIISTTPNWSRNLLALISNQQPPVQRLDLFGLEGRRSTGTPTLRTMLPRLGSGRARRCGHISSGPSTACSRGLKSMTAAS